MGIFNRNKKKENAVQINEVAQRPWMPWCFPHPKKTKAVSKVYMDAIMNLLWKGISNVTFLTSKKNDGVTAEIISFIDANATILMEQYIARGFICVFFTEKGEYRIPQENELKFDKYRRIINKHAVVLYSPQYQTGRISLLHSALPILADIDSLAGADEYVTDSLGLFGILSGQDIPINPVGREKLMDEMNDKYGTFGDSPYHYMLAPHDIKFTALQPNVAQLKLRENMKESFKILCNLFGVPLPLLFDDASTYNNVKEARISFYDTTIRYYAEILLKIGQELLTASSQFIPQNTLTYRFENLPELEKSLSSACEERSAYLDYLIKLKDSGIDVSADLNLLYNESKDLLKRI